MKKTITDLRQQRLAYDPIIATRYRYLTGARPLRFTSWREDLVPDLKTFHVNLAEKIVTTLTSMISVAGIDARIGGTDVSPEVNELWKSSNLADNLTSLCNSTMALGTSWLSIWVDKRGKATVAVEPTMEMSALHDPVTGEITVAAKLWESYGPNGVFDAYHCMLYLPDEIRRYRATTYDDWTLQDSVPNPLGVVPVVKLTHALLPEDRKGPGRSVLDASVPVIDAISRLTADLITSSASNAAPKRWVAGLVLEDSDADDGFEVGAEAVKDLDLDTSVKNPLDDDTWVLESENSKVGQLQGADLDNWSKGIESLIAMLSATSSLPLFSLGVTSSIPSSAEALRASRSDMEALVKAFLRGITTDVEKALRMMLAINNNAAVDDVDVQVRWSHVGQREISKTADAILKLVDADVITKEEAKELLQNV